MSILCIGLFIKDHGVLSKSRSCGQCDKTLNTVHCNSKGYHYFFCNSCKKKYSLRNGTILSLANISFRKIVFFVCISSSQHSSLISKLEKKCLSLVVRMIVMSLMGMKKMMILQRGVSWATKQSVDIILFFGRSNS